MRTSMKAACTFCLLFALVAPVNAGIIVPFTITSDLAGATSGTVSGQLMFGVDTGSGLSATSIILISYPSVLLNGGVSAPPNEVLNWSFVSNNSFDLSAGVVTSASLFVSNNSGTNFAQIFTGGNTGSPFGTARSYLGLSEGLFSPNLVAASGVMEFGEAVQMNVPTPATLGLLGLGLGLFGLRMGRNS